MLPLSVPGKSAPSSWSEHHYRTPPSLMFWIPGTSHVCFPTALDEKQTWQCWYWALIDSTQIRDDRRQETVTLLIIDLNTISSLPVIIVDQLPGILIPVLYESNHASGDWCQCQMWSGNSAPSLLIRSLALMLIHPLTPWINYFHPQHGSILTHTVGMRTAKSNL